MTLRHFLVHFLHKVVSVFRRRLAESMENIMRAYGVPQGQLITLRGGKDYEFGKFSWKVIPSVHSALDHKHCFSSKTFPDSMKAPLTLE